MIEAEIIQTGDTGYHERSRPFSVTQGLPHYVIGNEYTRLLKLVREYRHMHNWHGFKSRRLIEMQCERLHLKVYHEVCFYGAIPS